MPHTKGPWYCMVDRPVYLIEIKGDKKYRRNNKPRRAHPTLAAATTEAARLAKAQKVRVIILEAVGAVEPPKESRSQSTQLTARQHSELQQEAEGVIAKIRAEEGPAHEPR